VRPALLEVENLSVSFGSVRAVRDINLRVEQGAIVGLIGPNGAGKTTTLDALTGFVRCTGSVRFAGRDITHERSHVRARRGVTRTWQSIELFDDLSVRSNLDVATHALSAREVLASVFSPRGSRRDSEVQQALRRLGLERHAEALPSSLSHGQRKLVGVARALAGSPQLVLLDEPAAGLDDDETAELGGVLTELGAGGTTVLLIDHDMGLVLGTCDYVYVLDFGHMLAHGTPAAIRADRNVLAAYLGDAGGPVGPELQAVPGTVPAGDAPAEHRA
jgi:branched-chain amino acid transport system ATP-binding protein